MDSTTHIKPQRHRSQSLWYAQQAGLPVRMSYTISETARYSGMSEYQLRQAIRSGELAAKTPGGSLRGARIPVAAMDRWLES